MAVVLFLLMLVGPALVVAAEDEEFVFKSDVALIRVDVQVVDRDQRAITGLQASDFVLRLAGQPVEIKNFASEDMPLDVLFLLDVSGSMRPQVERIANAATDALNALGRNDRGAVMVFDRQSRVRMPFRGNRSEIESGLRAVIDGESFNGGTDINRGLLDAIAYIERNARRDARRAIVILTDDQTERDRDEDRIVRALTNANTVLSALLAPNMVERPSGIGGGYPRRGPMGGGWPNDPFGGIILGRRRGPFGGGGGGYPGPMGGGRGTRSAGTGEIAERSGGDRMPADDAQALETTLMRLRQRYALHFYQPGESASRSTDVEVELTAAARRRHPSADVRYRRAYMNGEDVSDSTPVISSRDPQRRSGSQGRSVPRSEDAELAPPPANTSSRQGGWRRTTDEPVRQMPGAYPERRSNDPVPAVVDVAPEPAVDRRSGNVQAQQDPGAQAPTSGGGWRRVKPGEQP